MKLNRHEIKTHGLRSIDKAWLDGIFYPQLSRDDIGITYSQVVVMDRKEIVQKYLDASEKLKTHYSSHYSSFYDGISEKMSEDLVYQNLLASYEEAKFLASMLKVTHLDIPELSLKVEYINSSVLYTFIQKLWSLDPTKWRTCDIKSFAGAYNALRNKVTIKHMENFMNSVLRILDKANTTVRIYSSEESMVKEYAKKELEFNISEQKRLKEREDTLEEYIKYAKVVSRGMGWGHSHRSAEFKIDDRVKKLIKILK